MKFNIEVEMEERWVPVFCRMLKSMEYLGNVGASRDLIFMSDGDGDFRPKFKGKVFEGTEVNEYLLLTFNSSTFDAG